MRPPAQGPSDKTLPTPDPAQVQLIRSYGPGRFVIGDREWHQAVLVSASRTAEWSVSRADELALANIEPLIAATPPVEILVVGCGARAVFIAPAVRVALKGAGMVLEVADTGSACRIYNVLLAEGRRAAAALIPL